MDICKSLAWRALPFLQFAVSLSLFVSAFYAIRGFTYYLINASVIYILLSTLYACLGVVTLSYIEDLKFKKILVFKVILLTVISGGAYVVYSYNKKSFVDVYKILSIILSLGFMLSFWIYYAHENYCRMRYIEDFYFSV